MTMEAEIWVSPDGVPCELTPVDCPIDDWYADFPGQRPPQSYELRNFTDDGVAYIVTFELTVFPLEPWSPYDAVSDRLIAYGWEPPPHDEETCEHGLSAWLCAGPMHYPEGE